MLDVSRQWVWRCGSTGLIGSVHLTDDVGLAGVNGQLSPTINICRA